VPGLLPAHVADAPGFRAGPLSFYANTCRSACRTSTRSDCEALIKAPAGHERADGGQSPYTRKNERVTAAMADPVEMGLLHELPSILRGRQRLQCSAIRARWWVGRWTERWPPDYPWRRWCRRSRNGNRHQVWFTTPIAACSMLPATNVRTLSKHQLIPSMSRPANPYDNASCESFIKTLKREEIYANQ
jgi:hypothetical protein